MEGFKVCCEWLSKDYPDDKRIAARVTIALMDGGFCMWPMGSRGRNYSDTEESYEDRYRAVGRKACRACDDFTAWRKNKQYVSKNDQDNKHNECPLDRDELGRSTWGFLHTMAAYYPEKPTDKQQTDMASFMNIFSKFYPCDYCASDFRKNMKKSPPNVSNRKSFSQWLCEQHNIVNLRLGKPTFDCSKVFERWKYGWKDGSCD